LGDIERDARLSAGEIFKELSEGEKVDRVGGTK
jgi:hypothetical protein